MTRILSLALGALLLTACTDPALDARVKALEEKVTKMEAAPAAAAAPGAPGAKAAPTPEDQAAIELYRKANEQFRAGDNAAAKQTIADLLAKYGSTRVAEPAKRLQDQLSVVGKDISELKVQDWIQGNTTLASGKATLVVFWEVWCPHCKEEVPKLEATYQQYKGQGLNLVGLTKMTKGKTLEDVKAFIAEKGVKYPIGHEDGSMSEFFGVSGVPAAAVVKGGKVVWRGHPAQITEDMLKGWLGT